MTAAARMARDLVQGTARAWIRELPACPQLPALLVRAQRFLPGSAEQATNVILQSLVPKLTALTNEIWNHASGALNPAAATPGRKSDKHVHKFLYGLFDLIAATDGHRLDDQDLFHAHLVRVDVAGGGVARTQDVGLFFHAKEFPTNLDPRAALRDVNGRASQQFNSAVAGFANRNYIWLLSQNKLWCISGDVTDVGHADFTAVLFPADEAPDRTNFIYDDRIAGRALKQDLFGTEVAGVNYFPNHIRGGHKHRKVFFK
ncbi:hypothetical protein CYFUS_003199 [Cystobacter fuscus]|uniref:Uncharacterized protein n=1 Tax=Cystobacter fuscus TaxID=43 RepID=A0A250J1B0_9BACT|nr:hypothetical protein [Cystobacter fuscus]ATB37774.1 hypothetical protein CYFUS_003199 [Cystobacter fuscus]